MASAHSPISLTTWFTIIRSSAGGMTRTVTGEYSLEMTAAPRTLLRLGSRTMPRALEARADFGAGVDVVFADAAGEDQHVQPVQLRHIAADPAGDGPGELVHGKSCLGVAGVDGLAQVAHVVGEFADAQQAGLLADHGFQLVGGLQRVRRRSRRSCCRMKISTPGSMSPVRVPLMMPPVGVRPIEVSRHWPLRMAEMDAPLPR